VIFLYLISQVSKLLWVPQVLQEEAECVSAMQPVVRAIIPAQPRQNSHRCVGILSIVQVGSIWWTLLKRRINCDSCICGKSGQSASSQMEISVHLCALILITGNLWKYPTFFFFLKLICLSQRFIYEDMYETHKQTMDLSMNTATAPHCLTLTGQALVINSKV